MRARPYPRLVIVVLGMAMLGPAATVHGRAVAGEPGLWERVASSPRQRFDRLVQDVKERLLKANDLAGAERTLREAVAVAVDGSHPGDYFPADFEATYLLAEVQSARDEPLLAVETLASAERLARFAGQKADCWFQLGVEHSKLGQYREALASYDRQLALGAAVGTVYANAAELLMALGRLDEAEDRYRDAIRVDEDAGDRRAREHALALSYYGLGVALDRDERPAAAREMMGRALALDPNQSSLKLAERPGSDVFFIPEGDLFYYLGLAAEADGQRGAAEAQAAFREFIARQPQSPWVRRARAHLQAPPPHVRWRTVAVATVATDGPLPAPLIDAAWKQRPPPVEECLVATSPPPGQAGLRVVLELELDARGLVTRAHVKLPPALDDGLAGACMEAAVKAGLAVTAPAHVRATTARVELLLANGDSGRL